MIILALDTTTRSGSVALLHDGLVRIERSWDPTITHGQRLPGALTDVLQQAGVRIEDIDLFAVAAGPGSFTGLRVGIATIQGLAMGHGKRVVAVSTLEALARAGMNAQHTIGTWMDAQREEVFAALYAADGRDVLIPPVSAPPRAILDAWGTTRDVQHITFIGDGAVRHADLLRQQIGADARVIAPPPLAGLIGQVAADDPGRAVLPHAIVPIYVRTSDAELARARRAAAQ